MDVPLDRPEGAQGKPAQREPGLPDEPVLEAAPTTDPVDLRGAGAAA
jgi:hypothetical protein